MMCSETVSQTPPAGLSCIGLSQANQPNMPQLCLCFLFKAMHSIVFGDR